MDLDLFIKEHQKKHYTKNDVLYFIQTIQNNLSDDLLKNDFLKQSDRHKTTGHCYVASEALYHLLGGKENLSSYTGRDEDNITHWWLVDKKTGDIYDPTAEQYFSKNKQPPYDKGKPCGFLTRKPSKRCQKLFEKIAQPKIQNKPKKNRI